MKSIAALALAAFVLMQASVAFAACDMDRAVLGPAMESMPCCGEVPAGRDEPMNPNVCMAHCTSDLHAVGLPAVLVDTWATPVLVLPRAKRRAELRCAVQHPPPSAVPPRILYQSFLI